MKAAVAHPDLLDRESYNNMDFYHWKDLAEKLLKHGWVDADFARTLSNAIVDLVSVSDFSVQLHFDGDAQSILRQIIDVYPEAVWEAYLERKDSASGDSEYRLSTLFGSDGGNPDAPGVLDSIPSQIMVPWMLEDRENRIREVTGWIKLFEGCERSAEWSHEFLEFVGQYVQAPGDLDPIRSRLVTGVWSGSWANKLHLQHERVEELRRLTGNTSVKAWAARLSQSLVRQIREAEREEANREAGYRA
ncbi:MAG: hypothetical protein AAF636_22325 [Pseudomonadota bacterium]